MPTSKILPVTRNYHRISLGWSRKTAYAPIHKVLQNIAANTEAHCAPLNND
ncbi:MAG: hypothetical protein ACYYK0_07255 [Candidatus Eutrophobiaceae bacterium]